MKTKNIIKENNNLENICKEYIMSDSKVFDVIKQGDSEEYNKYLRESIVGIIENEQNKFKDTMSDRYDKYLEDIKAAVLNDKLPIDTRTTIFHDAAEGLLIGGFA